ncbi:hypothetical protein C8J57DRAFT_1247798 [Mycena rebaudengoi]|nr:hypothetical protein C8J57DRAFT_1247798 [Mycena rebaudengoi]
MAPPPWATEEQRVWLDARMPRYVKLQADGKLSEFWPWVQGQWFNDFPEEAAIGLPPPSTLGDAPVLTEVQMGQLGNAIKKRKSQLDNWFRNQMNKQRRAAPVNTRSGESIANLLFKHKKKTRARRAIELYQMRNKTKIDESLELAGYFAIGGADADDNWVDESDGTRLAELKSLQSMRMRVRTRVVKALFDAEPESVRQELGQEAEEERRAKLEEAQEEEDEEESTSKSYLQSIDELADVYGKVHQATLKKAGWVTITITGGPNPRFNGELSMKVICAGVTAAGNNFEDAHPDFEKSVSLPFQQFLRRLFPPDVRRARALDSEEVAESDGEEPAAEKPKKAKRKKSKKSKSKVDADDTLPTGDALPGDTLPAGDTLPSGNELLPAGDMPPPDTALSHDAAPVQNVAAGGDPSTFAPFSPTIDEEELLRLLALDEQDRMSHDSFVGDGMDVEDQMGKDTLVSGGMDVDSVEPSWAQQFDPAMLPFPPSLSPAPSGAQPPYAASGRATPNGDKRQGDSPSKGQYAPPSHLFKAFSFNPPPPSSAPPSMERGSVARPGFGYPASSTAGLFAFSSQPPTLVVGPYTSTSFFSLDHAPPPPASGASASTPITTAVGSLALARASAGIVPAASRRPPGPSILGKQGRDIILAVLADGRPATAAGAAPAGAAAGAAGAGAAPAAAAGAAPAGAGAAAAGAPALLRPAGNLPTAFASPQKSAGRGPPTKQPGKGKAAATVAASAAGVGLDDLPVLQPTNIRRINQLADAAITERAAKKKADRERLRNPSGGADLVVVPLPPRERKRKELHDGTTAVMPRKRTRKEMEEEKVEALMLARREPGKAREPEKTVRAVAKTKATGAGRGAAPKKRGTSTRPVGFDVDVLLHQHWLEWLLYRGTFYGT